MQRLPIQRAVAVALVCLTGAVIAAEFKLKDGSKLVGDHVSSNDKGVVLNVDGKPTPRMAWTNFTQEALKEFARNPKARPYVELLIEDATPPGGAAAEANVPDIPVPKRPPAKWSEVKDKPELPEKPGLIGGMFTTGVGWFSLVMMYAGVVYAGYEVANYRRRPKQLVMGLSAIPGLGFFAPIVFLCLPAVKNETEAKPTAVELAAAKAKEEPKPEAKAMPGKKKPGGGLALGGKKAEEGGGHATPAGPKPVAVAKPGAASPAEAAPSPVKAPAAPALQPAVYRKGEVNINKRFIETKFAGFFKAVPAAPEKDMWLVWVTATGGEYWSKRVVSINQTEVVVNCPQEGGGSLDQTVQIVEIAEIHLRPQEG
jgi:hypothetical protein